MPRYQVEMIYDAGESRKREMFEFNARNDDLAFKFIKRNHGQNLSFTKRNVQFNAVTLKKILLNTIFTNKESSKSVL